MVAKFDPFLSLDCAPTPSTLAQSKERKGSNFAIWQPCPDSQAGGSSNGSEEMLLASAAAAEKKDSFTSFAAMHVAFVDVDFSFVSVGR